MGQPEKFILIDADVFIHLKLVGLLIYLPKIIEPYSLSMLKNVLDELIRFRSEKNEILNLIDMMKILIINLDSIDNDDMIYEYAKLITTMGDGESATLAYARFSDKKIISNNLSDIRNYCEANGILYLTTIDVFDVAVRKGIISLNEANEYMNTLLQKEKKVPDTSIESYRISRLYSYRKIQYFLSD